MKTATSITQEKASLFSLYTSRSVCVMFLCWMISGIPLLLTASTLSFWFNDVGISNITIGLLGWVAFPYSIKFLWAPIVDAWSIPYLNKRLGHRRSWMMVTQVGLCCSLFGLSCVDPITQLTQAALWAILISFLSATLSFVVMAYQIERLERSKYGAGEAMGIFGFRVGMLISGAGAISLASTLSWNEVYKIMALCMAIGPIITLLIREPTPIKSRESEFKEIQIRQFLDRQKLPLRRLAKFNAVLYATVCYPFRDFCKSQPWIMAILIMCSAKLSDNLIGNFTNIFLSEIGFSKGQIASVSKVFGMASTIIGGLCGGYIITKYGALKSLIAGIAIHACSILLFVLLSKIGPDLDLLYLTIGFEHFTGGLRTTSLLVLQMMLVNPLFCATQISILNSALHFSRKVAGSASGYLISFYGWGPFFTICSACSILSLIVLFVFATITKNKYDHLRHL